MKTSDLLADYVTEAPNDQNPLDIFKGIWSSELPDPWKQLKAGSIPLFEDQRIVWAAEQLGGVRGLRLLELGPLEAGHTYMLESMGAESIVAVEPNRRAYLKCLVVKEILNLKRSRFLLGDFVQFLRNTKESFDVCLASRVFYHMLHPAELIDLISRSSGRIVLWTTYYDEVIIQKAKLTHKFAGYVKKNHRGFDHVLHKYVYGDALDWGGFCGGSNSCSYWMTRDDILACLRFFGFQDLSIGCEEPDHPNGPAFCVVGRRRSVTEATPGLLADSNTDLQKSFGREYFEKYADFVPYKRGEPHYENFFNTVAEQIVQRLQPRTVLDVGCALGFLVEALRQRGVEAYGIDISEYAIDQTVPEIRPFCRVLSASEPLPGDFPEHYDLVTCIEILEHMPELEAKLAIDRMSGISGAILFSSTPLDVPDRTHINVHPVMYWLRHFADVGFSPDLSFDAGFIAPQAFFLSKRPPTNDDFLWVFGQFVDKRIQMNAFQTQLSSPNPSRDAEGRPESQSQGSEEKAAGLKDEIVRLNRVLACEIAESKEQRERFEAALLDRDRTIESLRVAQSGLFWELLCGFRRAKDRCFPVGTKRRAFYDLCLEGIKALKRGGLKSRTPAESSSAKPTESQGSESFKPRSDYKSVWNELSDTEERAKMHVAGVFEEDKLHATAEETKKVLVETVGIKPDDEVLEIGCGVGRVGMVIAPLCKRWIGCDVSSNMLCYAAERLSQYKNVSFIELSGFDLRPVADASVDLVYCTVVFMHLNEWDRFGYVLEGYRVLRPGGRLYIDNFNLGSDEGWSVFEAHRAIPPDQRPPHISKSSTPQELETYLHRASFRSVMVQVSEAWVRSWGTK